MTRAVIREDSTSVPADVLGRRVTILRVELQDDQPIAYVVDLGGEAGHLRVPADSLYTDRKWLHDTHVHSAHALTARRALEDWDRSREFYGPEWEGIELFHYHLAALGTKASIASPGWWRYTDSLQPKMDGKTWRLVLPQSGSPPTVVHCFSILHDGVWTLNTTVFSSRGIDVSDAPLTGHEDHWQRVFQWTVAVATVLQQDGYDYASVVAELQERARDSIGLADVARDVHARLSEHVENPGTPVSFGFTKVPLPATAVAAYSKPNEFRDYGTVSVDPAARKYPAYVEQIVIHELIHRALEQCCEDPHCAEFQRLARLMGLHKDFRD